MCAKFLLLVSDEASRRVHIAWEDVSLLKKFGGMNLSNCYCGIERYYEVVMEHIYIEGLTMVTMDPFLLHQEQGVC